MEIKPVAGINRRVPVTGREHTAEYESNLAMSELYYIQQKAGKVIPPPKTDQFREIGKQYGFPVGADKVVPGLSYHYGELFAEQGNSAAARYCREITYGLTDDEDNKR